MKTIMDFNCSLCTRRNILPSALMALALMAAVPNGAAAQATETTLPSVQTMTVGNGNIFDINFDMIYVEGGTFKMGAQNTDPNGDNYNPDISQWTPAEVPVHEVTVKSYYMARLEVTMELYVNIMGGSVDYGEENYAQYMSYTQAEAFVNQLNYYFKEVKPDRMPEWAEGFAIPHEDQWEYAATGGPNRQTYIYSGSNNADEVAVWRGATERAGKVATKKPNTLGIFDMTGNANEWCQEYYPVGGGGDYDGGYLAPDGNNHILRGGGVDVRSAEKLRNTYRASGANNAAMKYYGLRVVLNIKDDYLNNGGAGDSGESGGDTGDSGDTGGDSGDSGESGGDSGDTGDTGGDSGNTGDNPSEGEGGGDTGESGDDSGNTGGDTGSGSEEEGSNPTAIKQQTAETVRNNRLVMRKGRLLVMDVKGNLVDLAGRCVR